MDTLQKTVKKLPHTPGVYVYKDAIGSVLYVGKARNLYARVHQYFVPEEQLSPKTRQLVTHIRSIDIQQVATEFEALLLEAKLIRHYSPKYNMIAKDDKSPIYITIQKTNTLPIITLDRKPKTGQKDGDYFGPFPSRRIALRIIRMLRHSIPFCQQKKISGKPCFYSHIGLCLPCPSYIASLPDNDEKKILTASYKKNIQRLRWVLSGRTKTTIQSLQKEMITASKLLHFEKAGIIKNQIQTLLSIINNHYDPFAFETTDALERQPREDTIRLSKVLQPYFPYLRDIHRIECYDISNLGSTHAVGSLVVFIDGIPHTDQYRRFQIHDTSLRSDVKRMEEVVSRRFNHREWTMPDLIVVDGGKAQVSQIKTLLSKQSIAIPLIGLAKRFEQLVIPTSTGFTTVTIALSDPLLQLTQHIRDEAHRFAISYHKTLRNRAFAE